MRACRKTCTTQEAETVKLMYLAKRKKEFSSQEAFRARWRQHGALAMSLPTWDLDRRYVHADALPPSAAVGAHGYDGVGVVWFDKPMSFTAPTPEKIKTNALLLDDELKTFDGPVLPLAVMVEETMVKAGGRLTDVTAYLFFNDADAANRAAAVFANLKVPNAAERVAMNRVTDQAASATPLLGYKGIVEVAAASRKALDEILTAAAAKADLVVVARECLLWDHGAVHQSARSA
jgi:hypothetical protein